MTPLPRRRGRRRVAAAAAAAVILAAASCMVLVAATAASEVLLLPRLAPAAALAAAAARAPSLVRRASAGAGAAAAAPAAAASAKPSIFVDEERLIAEAGFALPPDQLIARAKVFLESAGGFGANPDLLAPDFQFVAPVVGPLSKRAFLDAIGQVDIDAAFPDFQGEFYGFHVEPFEGANRVWYTARGRGTHTGPLPPFAPVPTGKKLVNPPQVCSLTFDADGLVTKYTVGYVVDRELGNMGGLGGLYGVLYAIGSPLPFPEARPWSKSWQYSLFQKVGALLSSLRG